MSKIPTFLTYNGTAEDAVKLYAVFPNSRVLTMARYTVAMCRRLG